jgi:hypothetical protein
MKGFLVVLLLGALLISFLIVNYEEREVEAEICCAVSTAIYPRASGVVLVQAKLLSGRDVKVEWREVLPVISRKKAIVREIKSKVTGTKVYIMIKYKDA